MKIVIDARMMGPGVTRGIGRYTEELVHALLDLDSGDEFTLVTRSAQHAFSADPRVRTEVADIPWYGLGEQLRLPSILKKLKPDLVHFPHWNVPLAYSGKYVMTVHDLLLRHMSASAKASTRGPLIRWLKYLGYRLVLGRALAGAQKILVPTEVVRQDLEKMYPTVSGRVRVTGEGMPSLVTEQRRREVERPFLLYVGAAYPHKGLSDLLRAWPKLSQGNPALHLVVAGERDVFMRRIEESAHRLERVEFLGRVDEATLSDLYSSATALVLPTHFEGFGLTPLEALAHGCPVVCSDLPVLREVLGEDGALFFRAGASDGIISCVEQVLRTPDEKSAQAAAVALKLASRHSWMRAAQATLQAYREAV